MGKIADAVSKLLGAKVDDETIIATIAAMEAQPRSRHAIKQARYRERQKAGRDAGGNKSVTSVTNVTSKADKATRLPADWVLIKAWGDWAIAEFPHLTPMKVREIAADFKDHWISKAGRDARKVDWLATWRRWVREDVRRSRPGPARSGAARGVNKLEEMRQQLAEEINDGGYVQGGTERPKSAGAQAMGGVPLLAFAAER